MPFYTNENDPNTIAFLGAATVGFKQNHPDIDIPINFYNLSTAGAFLDNAFRTGHDVGIISPPLSFVPGWAQSGFLLPMDDVIKAIGPDDFIPGTRISLNGHDWHMPWQKSAVTIWYRKDILQQVGVSSPPQTYDDFVSTLKLVHGRNGMIGLATAVSSAAAELTLESVHPFILQSGWGYFDHNAKLTYNQPAVLDGVNRFVNLLKNYSSKNLANGGYTDVSSAYITGRAVFCAYVGRVGSLTAAQAPKIAEVTDHLGAGPGGPFMTGKLCMGFPRGYCIDAKTSAPTEAQAYVQYLTTGDNAIGYALTVPGTTLPPLKSVSQAFLDTSNKQVAANSYMSNPQYRDWVARLAAMVQYSTSEEYQMGAVENQQFNQISNVNPFAGDIWKANGPDTTMFQQIILNGADSTTAWKSACTAMQAASDAYLKAHPNWKPNA